MVNSVLITGGDESSRKAKALDLARYYLGEKPANHPDFLLLEKEKSILIGDIRELQRKLHLKPYQAGFKVALIFEAQRLTLPAQQSLLKILEEPPAASVIILTSPARENLLPTIISRCRLISLPGRVIRPIADSSLLPMLEKILRSSSGRRIILAQPYAVNRRTAEDFCLSQINLWQALLKEKISRPPAAVRQESLSLSLKKIGQGLRQSQRALLLLNANCHPRLVVENLLLSYPKLDKIKNSTNS